MAERSYDVHIDRFTADAMASILAEALGQPSGVAVLVDSNLASLSPRVQPLVDALAARFSRVAQLALPAGEACKNLATIEKTCEWMVAQGFDRGTAVLGLGGGATTDHAGFVAAIYMRGVKFALCPTTLLAMVDASVGGKTGVDLVSGKNLVGAFYQPSAVVADLSFLETLPRREWAAGMAEVVKAGLIADPVLFERLEAAREVYGDPALVKDAIAAAVRVKIDVVSEDERESGRRAILNFGHTLGHAVESASNFELLHGEAVSLGMIAALALGRLRGVTAAGLLERSQSLLERLALPVDVGSRLSPQVLALVEADKKRRSNGVRFVFVPELGKAILEDLPLDTLKQQVVTALAR